MLAWNSPRGLEPSIPPGRLERDQELAEIASTPLRVCRRDVDDPVGVACRAVAHLLAAGDLDEIDPEVEIPVDVLRADPGGPDQLDRVCPLPGRARVVAVVGVVAPRDALRGVGHDRGVVPPQRALEDAALVDEHGELAGDRLADLAEERDRPVDVGREVDHGGADTVEPARRVHRVHLGEHGDVELEVGVPVPHDLHHERVGEDDALRPHPVEPLAALEDRIAPALGQLGRPDLCRVHHVDEADAELVRLLDLLLHDLLRHRREVERAAQRRLAGQAAVEVGGPERRDPIDQGRIPVGRDHHRVDETLVHRRPPVTGSLTSTTCRKPQATSVPRSQSSWT